MIFRYLLIPCLAVSIPAYAQPDLNLSFELAGNSSRAAAGWYTQGDGYIIARDTSTYTTGSASLRLTATSAPADSAFAMLVTTFPLQLAAGHTLELRADIKTEAITKGYAGLWARADKARESVAFMNSEVAHRQGLQPAPPSGTTDWARMTVRIDVPPDATRVLIGGLHTGTGSTWFDNMEVYLDGTRYGTVGADIQEFLPSPLGPQRPEVEWLRQYVHPLASVDPRYGDTSDLQAFGQAVGKSGIVALGESTHGSREIFQLKDRLFRYLNRERGFGTFAIEASMIDSFTADEYVQGGAGSPEEVLRSLGFWTWKTEELVELVAGMRAAARVRPARFTGFDMQDYRPAFAAASQPPLSILSRGGRRC